jgi:hypothetical protein
VLDVRDLRKENEYAYLLTRIDDSLSLITNKYIHVLDNDMKVIRTEPLPIFKIASQISYRRKDRNGITWYTTVNDGIWCNSNIPNILDARENFNILKNCIHLGSGDGQHFWWDKETNILYGQRNRQIKEWKIPAVGIPRKIIPYNTSKSLLATSVGLYLFDAQTGSCENFANQFYSVSSDNFRFYNNASYILKNIPDSLRRVVFSGISNIHQRVPNQFYATTISGMIEIKIDEKDNSKIMVKLNEWGRYTNIAYDSVLDYYIFSNNEVIRVFYPSQNRHFTLDKSALAVMGIFNWSDIKIDRYSNVYVLGYDRLWQANPLTLKVSVLESNINLDNAKMTLNQDRIMLAGKFGIACYLATAPMSIFKEFVWPNINFQNYKIVTSLVAGLGNDVILNTDRGVLNISMTELDANPILPRVLKNAFKFSMALPYFSPIDISDTLYLAAGTSRIDLEATNFLGNGEPTYRYRINGFDDELRESTSGEVQISGLEPGQYYQVECSVSDATWTSDIYSPLIYIEPYWWQQRQVKLIAFVLLFLTIVAIIIGIILLTRYLVANANEKRRFQTELELRAIHSQINPHFIFNTLSTALFFISKERTSEAYNHVSKFSKLLRGYLKFSRERFITLADEIEMLRQYIELQVARFQSSFTYNIDVDLEMSPSHIMIPSLLLQPIVENAINHGLFNKGENGILIIKFQKGSVDTELICVIDDNGIGREKAQALVKRLKDNKPSYGSTLTRELIDIFKKYDQMDISIEYIDKQLPETGTTVRLVIRNARIVSVRADIRN